MNWLEELTSWVEVGCGGGREQKGVLGHMAFLYLDLVVESVVTKVSFSSSSPMDTLYPPYSELESTRTWPRPKHLAQIFGDKFVHFFRRLRILTVFCHLTAIFRVMR